jgi:MFS transporter, AAHS family, 4-hydroxybenzoate transporter
MSETQTINISKLVDERKVDRLCIRIVILTVLMAFFEGYDQASPGFVAPALIKAWHITNKADLGPIFSAGLFGSLIGAPLFGYFGDRFGRKKLLLLSILLFAALSIVTTMTSSLQLLFWVRLLVGVGLGGTLPNLIAINAEFAPKHARATMIIIMSGGLTAGGAGVGAIAAWLIPHYGWTVVFWFGGLSPIVIVLLAAYAMPESPKFLVLRGGPQRRDEIARIAKLLDPRLVIGPATRFILADEKVYSGASPKYLFRDGFALMTVLLWVCCIVAQTGLQTLNSWVPTLLTSANMSQSNAILALSIFYVGGEFGPLLLCRPMDTKGLGSMAVLFGLTIFVVGGVGFVAGAEFGVMAVMVAMFVLGACVLGLQAAVHAPPGMIYPTSIRSNGSGWAFGVARCGSVAGPLLVALLVSRHTALVTIFIALAAPYIVGTAAAVWLATLYARRFGKALLTTNSARGEIAAAATPSLGGER